MNGTQKNLETLLLSYMFLRLHNLFHRPVAGRSTKEVPFFAENIKKIGVSFMFLGDVTRKYLRFFADIFKFLGEIMRKIRFFLKFFYFFQKKQNKIKYFFWNPN